MNKWTHDCDKCRFLGQLNTDAGSYDLYHCQAALLGGSLIARYGSDGPEYMSVPFDMASSTKMAPLQVAAILAK